MDEQVDIDPGDELEHLIGRADLDGLVRYVDAACESRDWKSLIRTRDLCRAATRTGRQVWPVATLCEYRLALRAPAQWAHLVIDNDASRFSIGPLTEVIAQNHSWSELATLLGPGPQRDIVAHEFVICGEAVNPTNLNPSTLDLPFHLCTWEPTYTRAEYSDEGVVARCPTDRWVHEWVEFPATDDPITDVDDDDTEAALRSLVEPWTAASGGRAQCHIVEGGLESLARAMDRQSLRASSISAIQALDWLAWCGASGGAHGRRRGSAAGRFNTWWMLAALGGIDWDESTKNETLSAEIERVVERLDWYRIDSRERHSYELSLVAVDNEEDITFGLFAFDDPL